MDQRTLAEVSEEELLATVFPLFAAGNRDVLLGPGDDTAMVAAPSGAVLATTDTMVRGHDWLDDWSTPQQVGAKNVAQNLADIASMGGVPTGLLVTVAADPATTLEWMRGYAHGVAASAAQAHAPIVGGDLSAAPAGVVMVSITALGDAEGREPVRRSGATPGDIVAVAGTLGRSSAGWALLTAGRGAEAPGLVSVHLDPRPPYAAGPQAARAGAVAMIDLSDGLVRDAGRVARASGVIIELDTARLRDDVDALELLGDSALTHVLTGGEEHSLLACFPGSVRLPEGWRRIGVARAAGHGETYGVRVDSVPWSGGGFDHFRG